MIEPHPITPASGGLQTLVCPRCQASIRARNVEVGRQLRCALCRGLLSGDTLAPVQWLYPERRRTDPGLTPGSDGSPGGTWGATGLTQDPGQTDAVASGPRRVGRYELRGELGRGGMGVVYAGWDTDLQRDVALKVLLSGGFASVEARQRFIGEARAAAGLHHVHIVRVFDMGEVEGQPWFAMERVFGPSLEDVITSGGPMATDEAARIGAAVASAVAHAHAAGVAHRDLKPGNVLLDGDGHPRITDFGLARPLDDTRHLTATAQILGTPSYMPPEVARAEPGIDWVKADVYGLGTVLYAAITGRPPIVGANLNQRLEAAARGEHVPLRRLRPDVPTALDAVVSKALYPEVAGRYANAAALADDLRRFLAGEAVHARPETRLERARRWSRRHAVQLAIGLVVTVALLATAAWAPVQSALAARRREAAADQAWAGLQPGLGTPAGEALLDELLNAEPYRGSRAVAVAWLRRGDDLAKRPQPRGEGGEQPTAHVDAWARALTEAPDPTIRGQALLRLGRDALERRRYRDVRVLLDAIAALPASTVPVEELLSLELEYAVISGDRSHASAAWDQAQALELLVAERVADPDWELPGLDAAEELDLPPGELVFSFPRGGGPLQAIIKEGTQAHLFELAPRVYERASNEVGALRPHVLNGQGGVPALDPWAGSVSGDVDGDGVQERWLGARREVCRFRGDVCEPMLPELIRTNAELVLHIADLDAEGGDELIVGTSEWRGYDLRVYSMVDGALRLRARTQRNEVGALTTIKDPWGPGRLIVAGERASYPNAYKHGVDHPQGPPPAIVVRRLTGDRLEELFTQPYVGLVAHLSASDVDGDGHDEIVAGLMHRDRDDATLILRAAPTPGFAAWTMIGTIVVAADQLDDDPEVELIALRKTSDDDGDHWILGRGTLPVPEPAPATPPPPLQVPDGAPEGPLAQAWQDAALLVDASLVHSAARLLQRSAALAREAEAAEGASRLWERLGRLGLAAQAMELAAEASAGREARARWEAAVQLHLEAADPDAALRVAERWRSADGRGAEGALEARLAGWRQAKEHRLVLTPGAPLDDRWRVVEPLAMEPREGQLWMNLLGGDRSVMEAPLRTLEGPVAIMFDTLIERYEWHTSFYLRLELGPEQTVGVGYTAYGAERAQFPLLECQPWTWGKVGARIAMPPAGSAPIEPAVARFRLTWTPEDNVWRCEMALPDHDQEVVARLTADPPADFTLKLGDHGTFGGWIRVRVDRLEVWGVQAIGAPPGALQRSNHALLRQDPAAALAALPADAWMEQAVAQAALRRPVEAMASFSRALTHTPDALTPRLPYLLRGHRAAMAPLLRTAAGDRWPGLFEAVYHNPIRGNLPTPDIEEALRAELEDVALPADPEDPAWWLMAQRVGALLRGPDPARGRAAAAAWLQAFEALDLPRDHDGAFSAYAVHYELALAAIAAGDLPTAAREAQLAVDISPTPVVAPDRFAASPVWRASGLPLPIAHPWD